MSDTRPVRTVALLPLLLVICAQPRAAAEVENPCTGFLIPPGLDLREKPFPGARILRKADAWLIALPHPGRAYMADDKVRVTGSEKLEQSAGCYQRDFTVEGDFIRLWISPEEFRDESAWLELPKLETFSYPHAGRWRTQDPSRTLWSIREAAAKAVKEAEAARAAGGGTKSVRVTFRGSSDAIWTAALEGLFLAGWKVDTMDRGAGVVSTKSRKVPARTATTCARPNDDEEAVWVSLLLVPAADQVEVRVVLSFDASGPCRSRGILEERVIEHIRSALRG